MGVVTLKPRSETFAAIDGTERDGFKAAVLAGLSRGQKTIPSRFFYDERGSKLFEDITELEEYYPTRCEMEVFAAFGDDLAALAPDARALIEYGSGSSRKIRALLEALPDLDFYVPIDISHEMLTAEAEALATDFPRLQVIPVHADIMGEVDLPQPVPKEGRLAFFPGSTIGNFLPREALHFLERVGNCVGAGGFLLIGVDMKKDEQTLIRAYDDAAGVTAAFNLNLLERVNRELGGDVDLASFAHEVRYNAGRGRIEMHLRSLKAQEVAVCGKRFSFAEGETIHTENSHKFTVSEFHLLARASGFEPVRWWQDGQQRFSVHLLKWGAAD